MSGTNSSNLIKGLGVGVEVRVTVGKGVKVGVKEGFKVGEGVLVMVGEVVNSIVGVLVGAGDRVGSASVAQLVNSNAPVIIKLGMSPDILSITLPPLIPIFYLNIG